MNSLFAPWELANHTSSPWHIAAWTMCYFLIFGTAVAIAGAAIRFFINRAAPALRYAVSLAVFAALSILPVGIAIWLAQSPQVKLISVAPSTTIDLAEIPEFTLPLELDIEPLSSPTAPAPTLLASTLLAQRAKPVQESDAAWLIVYLPWLWIAGAPITFALLATGLLGSERLRRRCEPVASGIVLETAQRARASLNLTRKVSVVICDRIVQPVLIGIVRPLILLPPAALTGWSPEELEMVLLHELAHVRRWDNLVNLAQRLVESLLFFHPAVWLVSRRVRLDREQCCDAVVVAQTAAPQAYAELLVNIAAKGSQSLSLATASAMADHPLTSRIRRILKLEDEPMLVSRNTLGMISILLLAVFAAVLWQPIKSSFAEDGNEIVATQDKITAEVGEIAEEEVLGLVQEELLGITDAPPAIPVFLSLEDQKLADLAYKMLGVELEQLGIEELARVKAMKFEGGLLVTKGNHGDGSSIGFLQYGDILVGLHVWPTQSLEDVTKVLQRDDIAELSPLKFFVIRGYRKNNSSGAFGAPDMVDKLVTGRVEVNLDAVANKMRSGNVVPQPQPTLQHSPVFAPMPVNPNSPIFLGEPIAAPQISAPYPYPAPSNRSVSNPGMPQKALLYDGKTFDQWREMWKTELKVEKRTECVNALAAFARAGHAKAAAETILDVAGEYDFTSISSGYPEGKLKQRILDIFTKKILASTWLAPLLDRYETDEKKWGKLTRWLLRNLYHMEEPERQQLLDIANSDHSLRKAATQVLIKTDRSLQHPETVELARKALQGEHPDTAVFFTLGYRHLDQVPEQFDLLFHSDRKVRHATRSAFPNRIPQTVERKLFDVLYDPDQSEKHLFAIRAISYPNNYPNPDPLEALLLRIAREGDKQLLGAALFGLTKVMSVSGPVVLEVVAQEDLDEDRKKLLIEDGVTILLQEKFHMTQGGQAGGGGGGGQGGGGGGGFF